MADLATLPQLLEYMAAGASGPPRTLSIPGHDDLVRLLLRKYPAAFAAWSPPLDDAPLLTVITFNLAYNAQINFASGTEEAFVRACQEQPGGNNIIKETGFSVCSTRALEWIKRQKPDLVGLQEVNTGLVPDLRRFFENDLRLSIHESVGLLYRERTTGRPTVLSKGGLIGTESFRYFYIVWFSRIRTLVIVLHAQHNIRLQKEIEAKVNGALHGLTINPRRILCIGDFNDDGSTLKEIKLMNQVLRQHQPTKLLTCCYPEFKYTGDYIFDTNYNETAVYYAGDPWEKSEPLMSDHRPVTLRDINIFS